MKNIVASVLSLFVTSAVLVGCANEESVDTTSAESALKICTPGAETCDFGCFFAGGPSTDDCIVQCNSTGTAWVTIESCGYAQNFPFSASCLNSQPHPVCENN